jgi:hypothetical protein
MRSLDQRQAFLSVNVVLHAKQDILLIFVQRFVLAQIFEFGDDVVSNEDVIGVLKCLGLCANLIPDKGPADSRSEPAHFGFDIDPRRQWHGFEPTGKEAPVWAWSRMSVRPSCHLSGPSIRPVP